MGRKPLVEKPEQSPEYCGGYMDGERIHLMYRSSGGELRERFYRARLVSYHRLYDDLQKHIVIRRELEGSKFVLRVDDEAGEYGNWVRVEWRDYEAREKGVSWLDKQDVRSWEADVSPIKRHFADGEDRTTASPLIAYLDIETDSRVPFADKEKMRVLCWCVVDGATGEHLERVLSADTDEAEAELLEALWEALQPYDVVAAWYGDGFDFPVIQARSKRLGLGINYRRWRWLDSLEVFRNMNAHVAETGDEKQSMALNAICQSMLGEGKHEFDASQTWQEWEAGGERRETLLRYNIQDTLLLYRLERKTQYTSLFGTICAAAGLFVETKSLGAHQQMDGFMLRLGRKRGYHWPTKPKDSVVREKYKGAWVMQAPERAGILRGVHVMDFSGMYPSIMISWNMSPETVRETADDKPVARSPLTKVNFYTDREGLMSSALRTLREMRKGWADKKASLPPGTPEWQAADRWAMAYKIAANSMYGVIGMAFGRYYNPRIAESVTQNGVWLINQTTNAGSKRGINTIYGDTDSGMAVGVDESTFRDFVGWCNAELYPRLLKEQGCQENCISLAYEKEFERLVFVASKKYIGRYSHYKGKLATADSKPEVRGMEFKRGDAVLMARRLQGEIIEKLMRECCDDPTAYEPIVEKFKDHALNDQLELAEVVLSKSLSKTIAEYIAETPPVHVRVAQLMKDRGEDVSVGQKIPYVIVDHNPKGGEGILAIPAKDWTGEVDRYGLWESMVWPPTERLLDSAFPNHDWSRFGKVRPKEKSTAKRKSKDADTQLGLLSIGTRGLALKASIPRGFNEQGVKAAKAILDLAKDGETPVTLSLEMVNSTVVLETGRRITVDPVVLRRLRSLLGDQGVCWNQ